MKVITFSLWGDRPTYNIGVIKNAQLALTVYPDFECWIYIHKETVPQGTIDELNKMNNVKIIMKDGDIINEKCMPRNWRFEAIDDPSVEIMLSRDADTRILLREKLAVEEWLKSGKLFHIMRDHPHHSCKILAGMFGTKKIPALPNWKEKMGTINQTGKISYDQDFLVDIIYPIIKNNSIIHASFHRFEPDCNFFPIKYDNAYNFVGQYVYEDETRSETHTNILINSAKNKPNLV